MSIDADLAKIKKAARGSSQRRKPLPSAGTGSSVGEATHGLAARFLAKTGDTKGAAKEAKASESYRKNPGKQRLNKVKPREIKTAGPTISIPGVARVVAGTAPEIGRALLPHHLPGTAIKSGKFIGEAAVGLGATLQRVQQAAQPGPLITGKRRADETPGRLVKELVKATGEAYAEKYGPAYKGKPGGVKHLRKVIREEGPLPTVLDAVSVVAPLDAAAVGAARSAKSAKQGSRAEIPYIDKRPEIRKSPTEAPEAQRGAVTVTGATRRKATDASRRAAQAAAKKRAAARAKADAAKGTPGKRPLTAVRAAAQPGEVVPIFAKSAAKRRAKGRAATSFGRAGVRTDIRTAAAVAPMREAAPKIGIDDHYAAKLAAKYGLRSSADAKAFLTRYADQIDRSRAAAADAKPSKQKKKGDPARVEFRAAGDPGELPAIRALIDDPRIFDDPGLHEMAGAIGHAGRSVEAAGLVSAERAEIGRSGARAAALGVDPPAAVQAGARKADLKERDEARREAKRAYKERDKVRATGARVLAAERANVAEAKGRAAILTRNVTGKERVPGSKADGVKPRYAGGGLGVRQAEESLAKAQAAVGERVGAATESLTAARTRLKSANQAPAPRRESTAQFIERERTAAAEVGNLAAPEYVPAKIDPGKTPISPGRSSGTKNPLAKNRKRTDVLTQLGRDESTLGDMAATVAAEIRKGTLDQEAGRMLRQHGVRVADADEAYRWADANGIGRATFDKDLEIWRHAEPGKDKPELYIVDKNALHEWDALVQQEGTLSRGTRGKLRQVAAGAQAVLLGSNPGWWAFQRVNNAMALTAGKSLHNVAALRRARAKMSPAEREALAVFSGGNSTRSFITVNMFDDLGKLQQYVDNAPLYRRAEKAKNAAGVLLRTDAKIEASVRELQLLNNLAGRVDKDVRAVLKSYRPVGQAMADGDMHALTRILTTEKGVKDMEAGAEALGRVHGEWHSLTSLERSFKSFVAFYGFLRYATRLAFATLPVRHPLISTMLLQQGAAENAYYEKVVGPDYKFARGTLLSPSGRSLGSMKRALPVAGGAMDLAQAAASGNITAAVAKGLTPAAAILLNTASGQKFSLDAVGEGRTAMARFEDNEPLGSLVSSNRAKFLAQQTLGLLGPIQALNAADRRLQTDESLPFARSYRKGSDPADQVDIEEQNRERQQGGGTLAVGRQLAPLVFGTPGTGENLTGRAKKATKARVDADYRAKKRKLEAADPVTQMKRDIALEKERMKRDLGTSDIDADLEQLKRDIELSRLGG